VAGTRAHFALPEDLVESEARRLGLDPKQAALWAEDYDDLEADEGYQCVSPLSRRGGRRGGG